MKTCSGFWPLLGLGPCQWDSSFLSTHVRSWTCWNFCGRDMLRARPSLWLRFWPSPGGLFWNLVQGRISKTVVQKAFSGLGPLLEAPLESWTLCNICRTISDESTLRQLAGTRPWSLDEHCRFLSQNLYVPGFIKMALEKKCSGLRPSLGVGPGPSHGSFCSKSVNCRTENLSVTCP